MISAEREHRYERLVNQHKDAVYRQIARICGNYDDTEDVLVETLLTAYRALDQVRDEGAMRGWMATIGRRICRRMKSKEALKPVVALGSIDEYTAQENVDEGIELNRLKACVRSAVEALPPIYREAYVLRELQGVSAEQAAKRLGISIANLKSRLHRSRKLVREALDSALCS